MKSEQEKSAFVSEAIRCLDELEQLVESSKSMPLTHHKIVDEDAFFVATQRLKLLFPSVAVEAEQKDSALLARLRRGSTLLCIVDVQQKLLPAIHDAEQIEKNCVLLARAARQLGIPMVITEQNPSRLGSTAASLREVAGEFKAIEKMSFSACAATAPGGSTLDAIQASGRDTILLCGVEAHVCVLQTALDLVDAEYSVFVARDAISSRTSENAQIGWERMMRAGVLPTSTESAIFELLTEAGTPDFKALLPFLK